MASFDKDSLGNTFVVAIVMCLICSVIVSGVAVALKPAQVLNKELDQKQNILRAAGMLDENRTTTADGKTVEELFAEFTVRVVDLESGEFLDDVDSTSFDPIKSAKDPRGVYSVEP